MYTKNLKLLLLMVVVVVVSVFSLMNFPSNIIIGVSDAKTRK